MIIEQLCLFCYDGAVDCVVVAFKDLADLFPAILVSHLPYWLVSFFLVPRWGAEIRDFLLRIIIQLQFECCLGKHILLVHILWAFLGVGGGEDILVPWVLVFLVDLIR